jgi:hypothetical protein
MGHLGKNWLVSKPLVADIWRTNRERAYRLPSGEPAGPDLPLVEGENFGHFLTRDGRRLGTVTQLRSPAPHVDVVLRDVVGGTTRRLSLCEGSLWNPFELWHTRDADGMIFIQAVEMFRPQDTEFTTELFEVDPSTDGPGAVRKVCAVVLPTVAMDASGARMLTNTSFAAFSRGGEVNWALLNTQFQPTSMGVLNQEVIVAGAGGVPRHVPLAGPEFGQWPPRLLADGSAIEIEDNKGWTTWRISLADGSAVQTCAIYRESLSRSDNGVCLYLNAAGGLEVAMDGQPPLARLKVPARGFVRPADISPDGRWAAAVLYDRAARTPLWPDCEPLGRTNDVLIWDLAPVLARPAPR